LSVKRKTLGVMIATLDFMKSCRLTTLEDVAVAATYSSITDTTIAIAMILLVDCDTSACPHIMRTSDSHIHRKSAAWLVVTAAGEQLGAFLTNRLEALNTNLCRDCGHGYHVAQCCDRIAVMR
jgi:hypothetical protein